MTGHVVIGFVEEVLAREAAHGGLVVVGSLGRRKPARWLVGSNAERAAQASPVPVLVVRDAAPFEAWARRARPLRLAVGVELSRTSRAALAWASELVRAGDCVAQLIHVALPSWEAIRLGQRDAPHDRLTPEAERIVRRDLALWAGEVPSSAGQSLDVVSGTEPTEQQLAAAAAAWGADLLVVGTHQRSRTARFWYGSVSRGALSLGSMSVALVPAGTAALQKGAPHPPRRSLVPVDFSKASVAAVEYAYLLAPDDSLVHLLHVVRPADGEADEDELHRRLAALGSSSAAERGVVTSHEVVHASDVATAIWQASERLGADLLCMPSRGRVLPFAPATLGTTAQGVVARCACPVVLTPPDRGG